MTEPAPSEWRVGPYVRIAATSGATHRMGRPMWFSVHVRLAVMSAPGGSSAGPTIAHRRTEVATFEDAGVLATEWAAWADQANEALRNIGIVKGAS